MTFRQCFSILFFFRFTWSDQNSSTPKVIQNFKKPNCTRWPKELNQKGFPRNIQYQTRLKGPPLSFFCIATLFREFFSQMVPLQFFWSFATEWMLKNPKGSPFQFFFGIVRLSKKFHERVPDSPILWHFEVLLLFLSLRYGADSGRSRLVILFRVLMLNTQKIL